MKLSRHLSTYLYVRVRPHIKNAYLRACIKHFFHSVKYWAVEHTKLDSPDIYPTYPWEYGAEGLIYAPYIPVFLHPPTFPEEIETEYANKEVNPEFYSKIL